MKIIKTLENIRSKWQLRVSDRRDIMGVENNARYDDDNWITINGTHVMVGEGGTIKGSSPAVQKIKKSGKNYSEAKRDREKKQSGGGHDWEIKPGKIAYPGKEMKQGEGDIVYSPASKPEKEEKDPWGNRGPDKEYVNTNKSNDFGYTIIGGNGDMTQARIWAEQKAVREGKDSYIDPETGETVYIGANVFTDPKTGKTYQMKMSEPTGNKTETLDPFSGPQLAIAKPGDNDYSEASDETRGRERMEWLLNHPKYRSGSIKGNNVYDTNVGQIGKQSEPKSFCDTLDRARESRDPSTIWRVDKQTPEEMAINHPGAKCYTTQGGSAYAVDKSGDIFGLCKNTNDPAKGKDILKEAVSRGGNKLDSYDGNHEFYSKCGFQAVSWCKWDEKYKPSGWDPSRDNREDIVFYKYVGVGNVTTQDLNAFKDSVPASKDYGAAGQMRNENM